MYSDILLFYVVILQIFQLSACFWHELTILWLSGLAVPLWQANNNLDVEHSCSMELIAMADRWGLSNLFFIDLVIIPNLIH
ncbi:hypothetical protein DAI22_03g062500 [Oryza sativa Japonica Group]|nr:hypothetical protein DAI22_03g062500 [Oryza sativa Japonica Group]